MIPRLVQTAADEFDGHAAFKFIVGAHCQIYRAHSTAPNFADRAIGANAAPDYRVQVIFR